MFEEIPGSRRGLARLVPVRRVVLGPFVLGSGMLLAAVGGSVAVAATVITASTIVSKDVPPHPGYPAPASSSTRYVSAARSALTHRTLPKPAASRAPVQRSSAVPAAAAGPAQLSSATAVTTATATGTVGAAPVTADTIAQPAGSSAPVGPVTVPAQRRPATMSSPAAAPSASVGGPVGNALVYFTGYDRVRGRIDYRFATRTSQPGAGGGYLYQVSGPQTYTATLAGAIVVTSGGTICSPAASSCTVDQLTSAADSGFFAEVAIDAAGRLRSVVEVGGQAAAARLAPTPSTSAPPVRSGPVAVPTGWPTAGTGRLSHR